MYSAVRTFFSNISGVESKTREWNLSLLIIDSFNNPHFHFFQLKMVKMCVHRLYHWYTFHRTVCSQKWTDLFGMVSNLCPMENNRVIIVFYLCGNGMPESNCIDPCRRYGIIVVEGSKIVRLIFARIRFIVFYKRIEV